MFKSFSDQLAQNAQLAQLAHVDGHCRKHVSPMPREQPALRQLSPMLKQHIWLEPEAVHGSNNYSCAGLTSNLGLVDPREHRRELPNIHGAVRFYQWGPGCKCSLNSPQPFRRQSMQSGQIRARQRSGQELRPKELVQSHRLPHACHEQLAKRDGQLQHEVRANRDLTLILRPPMAEHVHDRSLRPRGSGETLQSPELH
eukprot:13593521-Alexandrium_andersonii.AAC.1